MNKKYKKNQKNKYKKYITKEILNKKILIKIIIK